MVHSHALHRRQPLTHRGFSAVRGQLLRHLSVPGRKPNDQSNTGRLVAKVQHHDHGSLSLSKHHGRKFRRRRLHYSQTSNIQHPGLLQ